MSNSAVCRIAFSLLAATLVWGCDRGDREAQNVPLGQGAAAGNEAAPTITGEAKVALDSANILFRARAYDQALAQYRRSAQLAPAELTPLLGILMVAEATNDTALVRSTTARVRELDPGADTTLTGHGELVDLHSRSQTPPSP